MRRVEFLSDIREDVLIAGLFRLKDVFITAIGIVIGVLILVFFPTSFPIRVILGISIAFGVLLFTILDLKNVIKKNKKFRKEPKIYEGNLLNQFTPIRSIHTPFVQLENLEWALFLEITQSGWDYLSDNEKDSLIFFRFQPLIKNVIAQGASLQIIMNDSKDYITNEWKRQQEKYSNLNSQLESVGLNRIQSHQERAIYNNYKKTLCFIRISIFPSKIKFEKGKDRAEVVKSTLKEYALQVMSDVESLNMSAAVMDPEVLESSLLLQYNPYIWQEEIFPTGRYSNNPAVNNEEVTSQESEPEKELEHKAEQTDESSEENKEEKRKGKINLFGSSSEKEKKEKPIRKKKEEKTNKKEKETSSFSGDKISLLEKISSMLSFSKGKKQEESKEENEEELFMSKEEVLRRIKIQDEYFEPSEEISNRTNIPTKERKKASVATENNIPIKEKVPRKIKEKELPPSPIKKPLKRGIHVFTSSSPTGKTFVALNTASFLAKKGVPTILIDLDFRNYSIQTKANVPKGEGKVLDLFQQEEPKGFTPAYLPKLKIFTANEAIDPVQFTPEQMKQFWRNLGKLRLSHAIIIDIPFRHPFTNRFLNKEEHKIFMIIDSDLNHFEKCNRDWPKLKDVAAQIHLIWNKKIDIPLPIESWEIDRIHHIPLFEEIENSFMEGKPYILENEDKEKYFKII